MRSNCLFFALALYRRRRKKGRECYLLVRRSRWGPFPHVLFGERRRNGLVRMVSYRPTEPKAKPVPPALFKGSSKWGDLS